MHTFAITSRNSCRWVIYSWVYYVFITFATHFYHAFCYYSSCVLHMLKFLHLLTLSVHILQGKKMEATPLAMYNYFIDRVRQNLHVVLAMSPIGDAFRNRLRMFPSLINCCTIDWFQVWRRFFVYNYLLITFCINLFIINSSFQQITMFLFVFGC